MGNRAGTKQNMTKTLFTETDISPEILRAVSEMGFTEMTPIQAQSIPLVLAGHDLLGQAKTGTGKTAAFGIPAIMAAVPDSKRPQVLVLCPTRELAMQVAEELRKIAKYKKGVNVLAVYGGASIVNQIKDLKRGVEIVVGTPGRVMDHLERGTLKVDCIRQVILDEADEMLNMGFREDIEHILKDVPEERQTLLFSATMPKPILDITRRFQKNPQHIKVVTNDLTVASIEQRYFDVKEKDKPAVLARLVELYEPKLCLVFCNQKRRVDDLVRTMNQNGYAAEALHGDMAQNARTHVMDKFRIGTVKLLVATDVAARGIDVDDIEMVVNFDVPLDTEYYVHRIGRTGRAGRSGYAFSFVSGREAGAIRDIERFAKTKIEKGVMPTVKNILEKKKKKFFDKIIETIQDGKLTEYITWEEELIEMGCSKLDIAAALMKMYSDDQLSDMAKNSKISEASSFPERREFNGGRNEGRGFSGGRNEGRSEGYERADRGRSQFNSKEGMQRIFINVGRDQKIGPKDIVGAIAGETGVPGRMIGDIDIYDKYTFVDVPKQDADKIIRIMSKSQIRGNRVRISIAEEAAR